jgi:hypothetical protein
VGKRVVYCPEKVFTLPLSLSFTINGVDYKSNILGMEYKERMDPLLVEHINWHLNPRVNLSHLEDDLQRDWFEKDQKIQDDAERLNVFQFHDAEWTWGEILVLCTGSVVVLITIIYILYRVVKCKRNKVQTVDDDVPVPGIPIHSIHFDVI